MPEMPQEDNVVKYLMGVNLIDHEADFRAVLENVAENMDELKVRDFAIATTAILMTLGGFGWPVVMRVMTHLSKLSDKDLEEAGVASINGAYLVMPEPGDTEIKRLDILTLRDLTEQQAKQPAFVSTVYSVSAIWGEVVRILL